MCEHGNEVRGGGNEVRCGVCAGEFFFDKTVSGFLRDLFVRWREAGCNHDVTIVFFWRLHYDLSSSKTLPIYMYIYQYMYDCMLMCVMFPLEGLPVSTSIREDRKRGIYYEDFFR